MSQAGGCGGGGVAVGPGVLVGRAAAQNSCASSLSSSCAVRRRAVSIRLSRAGVSGSAVTACSSVGVRVPPPGSGRGGSLGGGEGEGGGEGKGDGEGDGEGGVGGARKGEGDGEGEADGDGEGEGD